MSKGEFKTTDGIKVKFRSDRDPLFITVNGRSCKVSIEDLGRRDMNSKVDLDLTFTQVDEILNGVKAIRIQREMGYDI